MDKLIPVGTLVRVKDAVLKSSPSNLYVSLNRKLTEENGYLWFVQGYDDDQHADPNRPICKCKSLATGYEGVAWFVDELEEVEGSDG